MILNQRISDRHGARLACGIVGYALRIRPELILSNDRGTTEVARARQVSMYLCHIVLNMSLGRVANAFERDRSTVAHACHVIEDRRDDPSFNKWIEYVEDGIRAMEPLNGYGL